MTAQLFHQQLQVIVAQKQQLQSQLLECESALSQLPKEGVSYKFVGNILIEESAQNIKTDLESQKEKAQAQLASLDKQEEKVMHDIKQLKNG